MTLSLYFARRFMIMFLIVFGIFLGILWLIDTIEVLRRYSGAGISLGDAVILALLNTPDSLYRILPLLMILTSVSLFLALSRSSELVIVRASGRSGLWFLLAPVGTALLIGIIAVAVMNPLVAATSKRHAMLTAQYANGGQSTLSISADGLWMRQGAASGQSVIKAVASNADGTILTGLTIIAYATSGQIIERIDAQSATLESGAWVLRGVKRWDLQSQNPERDATVTDGPLRFPTNLTPDRIREGLGSARILSFWKLPSFITSLESAGFSARSQRLWLQIELAMPLLLAAMVLIAAGFTMRPARFGKTGTMVMYALLGGFFIFFLRNFAQVLGENGQIPVYLAAWSPPIAAIMLALALLLHLEDG